MNRPLPADRLVPWLLIGAFTLTLSALTLRDRLAQSGPWLAEPAPTPTPVIIVWR